MKVRITYSDDKTNQDNLYKIFSDIIKKDMEKNTKNKCKKGENNEKNSSTS